MNAAAAVFSIICVLLVVGVLLRPAFWLLDYIGQRYFVMQVGSGVRSIPAPPIVMSRSAGTPAVIGAGAEIAENAGAGTVLAPSDQGATASESQTPASTPGDGLVLSADEVRAIAAMIMYRESGIIRGRKPTKEFTIKDAFNVSKGTNRKYQRASEIYDALFGQPAAPAFRSVAPDGTPIRQF